MTISTKLKPLVVSYAIVAAVGCGSKGTISPKVPSQQRAVNKINIGLQQTTSEINPTKDSEAYVKPSASTEQTGVHQKSQDETPYYAFGGLKADIRLLAEIWDSLFVGMESDSFRKTLRKTYFLDFLISPALVKTPVSALKISQFLVGTDCDRPVSCHPRAIKNIKGIKEGKDQSVKERKAHMILVMLLALEQCSPDDKYLKALMQRSSSLKPEVLIEILMKKKKNRLAVIAALNKEMKKKRGDRKDENTSLIGTPYDVNGVKEIPGINRKPERKGTPYKIEDFIGKLTKEEEKKILAGNWQS